MAPAFGFTARWERSAGEKAMAAWRRRGTAPVYHYRLCREVPLAITLLDDARAWPEEPDPTCPTLVLHARRDDAVPLAVGEAFVAWRPDRRALVVYDAGPRAHRGAGRDVDGVPSLPRVGLGRVRLAVAGALLSAPALRCTTARWRARQPDVVNRLRADWPMFGAVASLAVILFTRVGTLPDWVPGRDAAPVTPGGVTSGEGVPVQDFAYIFNYARWAATLRHTSPYSVSQHRRFLTAWLGPQIGSALCFAYSPMMVLLLAPLFALPTVWAWLVWNLVSAWTATLAVRSAIGANRSILLLRLAAFVDPTVVSCLALGQTTLLTTGLLGILVLLAGRSTADESREVYGAAACVVCLSAKPPLAAVGVVTLLAAGRWRAVLVAAAACALVVAGAVAWWGGDFVADYIAMLGGYNLIDAPALFRAGLHPESMTNLRNVLVHTGWFDDRQAARLSWIPLAVSLAPTPVLALRLHRAVPVQLACAASAMAYLLFSPHLSSTEDFLLLVVPIWLYPFCHARAFRTLAALCLGTQILRVVMSEVAPLLGPLPCAGLVPVTIFGAKVVVSIIVTQALLAWHHHPLARTDRPARAD